MAPKVTKTVSSVFAAKKQEKIDYINSFPDDAKFYKWQLEVIKNVEGMNNAELFNSIIVLGQGDDYDGCFTKRGKWEYNYYLEEFWKKMREKGMVSEPSYDDYLKKMNEINLIKTKLT